MGKAKKNNTTDDKKYKDSSGSSIWKHLSINPRGVLKTTKKDGDS